ncbi:hypothetical protein BGZ73_006988 [Actinomortierella ambigua]|nr:hypothetical protein BGZ73_006988 [Actinomortierella ambigua]
MGAQQSRQHRTRSRSSSVSSAPPSPGFPPTPFNGIHPSLTADGIAAQQQQQQEPLYNFQQQQQGQHPHLPRQYHQLHHTWSQHDTLPNSPALSAESTGDLHLTSTRTSEGGGTGRLSAKKHFSTFLSNLKNRTSGSSTDPTGAGMNLSQDSLGTQTTNISDSTNTNQSANSSGLFNFAQAMHGSGGATGSQGGAAHTISPKEAARLAKKAEENARLADLREQMQQKKTNKLREKHMRELHKLQQQQLQEKHHLQQQQRRHSLYYPLPASIDAVPAPLILPSQRHPVTAPIPTQTFDPASAATGPCSSNTTMFPREPSAEQTSSVAALSPLDHNHPQHHHHHHHHRRSYSGPHHHLALSEAGPPASIATVLLDGCSSDASSSKSSATVVVATDGFDLNPLAASTSTAWSVRSAASSPLAEGSAWDPASTAMTPPLSSPTSSLQQQQPPKPSPANQQHAKPAPRVIAAEDRATITTPTPPSMLVCPPSPPSTATPSTTTSQLSSTSTNRSPTLEISNTSVVQTPELHHRLRQRKSMMAQGIAPSPTPPPALPLTWSVSSSTTTSSTSGSSTSTTKPAGNKGSTSKFGFIRGKAGFAWLEKRIAGLSGGAHNVSSSSSSSVHFDDETIERRLDEMEHEAAKQYKDRVAEQHFLMKDVMGANYHVPMDLTFKRVLENGCGAGDWTLDMASDMPETDFVGCPQIVFTTSNAGHNTKNALYRPRGLLGADQSQQRSGDGSSTSSSSTSSSSAPPVLRPRNCSFITTVPMNRLPFHNDHFDFVFQRRQSVVLLTTEWQRTILELFRVLKKGGWVELVEPDLCLRGGGELCQLAGEYCIGIFEALGRHPNVIHEMPMLLASAGFVNVQVKIWSMPLGWGGPVGKAMMRNQQLFVNEMEPMYVRQGHGTSQEYRELTDQIFQEAVDRRAYINYHSIIAQKPATASDRHKESKMSNMLA